jgi:uncharacterized protein YdcH (DUF465 family)
MNPFLPALLTLVLPLAGPDLSDQFKDNRAAWEESLDKGQSAAVRKATEALLEQQGPTVNPSDYNAMHALVAVRNLAARACVLDGAWEDAVAQLEKASQAATDNLSTAESTFSRVVAEHQAKLKEWRDQTAQQEQQLQGLNELPGLNQEQIKLKSQIQQFLDEHRRAIAQSEQSLQEIDGLLMLLKKEKEAYGTALDDWKGFLAKEQSDIARLGGVGPYVAEKLVQVKADDARPRTERLAYGRRLLHLDPGNPECRRFVADLEGVPAPSPAPKAKPKRLPTS